MLGLPHDHRNPNKNRKINHHYFSWISHSSSFCVVTVYVYIYIQKNVVYMYSNPPINNVFTIKASDCRFIIYSFTFTFLSFWGLLFMYIYIYIHIHYITLGYVTLRCITFHYITYKWIIYHLSVWEKSSIHEGVLKWGYPQIIQVIRPF